jgi:hypothetical protein
MLDKAHAALRDVARHGEALLLCAVGAERQERRCAAARHQNLHNNCTN